MANKDRRRLYNKLHRYLPARLSREILTAAQYNWDYLLQALRGHKRISLAGKSFIDFDPCYEEVYSHGDYTVSVDGKPTFLLHHNSMYGIGIQDLK